MGSRADTMPKRDFAKIRTQHLHFVAAYIQCRNCVKAAEIAGYAKHNANRIGHRLLHRPELRELINQELSAIIKRSSVTVNWVCAELAQVVEDSRVAPANRSDGVRALEQLGRHLGMWIDRSQVQVATPSTKVVVLEGDDDVEAGEREPVPAALDVQAEPSREIDW